MKCCLTIAGSDSIAGAGIQADIKTFSALGCYGANVITSVVAENTDNVLARYDMPAYMISKQLDAVFSDVPVDAVKIGMLPTSESVYAVCEKLREYAPKFIAADPIILATAGKPLMADETLSTFITELLPLCTLVTPNIPEVCTITGMDIVSYDDIQKACIKIADMGAENVLIKGGHTHKADSADILYDGRQYYTFSVPRLDIAEVHGTGCILSSAITAYFANGMNIYDAVKNAKAYITKAISTSIKLGKGSNLVQH